MLFVRRVKTPWPSWPVLDFKIQKELGAFCYQKNTLANWRIGGKVLSDLRAPWKEVWAGTPGEGLESSTPTQLLSLFIEQAFAWPSNGDTMPA